MIRSLRSRIALGTTVATAAVVLVAAVAVWFAGRTLLWRTIDTKLLEREHNYLQNGIPVPMHPQANRDLENPTSSFLTQVLLADGTELHRSPTLPAGIDLRGVLASGAPAGSIVAIRLADGRPARGWWIDCRTRVFGPGAGGGGREALALAPSSQAVVAIQVYDMKAFSDELERLAWLLAAVWVSAVALSALVSAWLCGAVLRPVDRLSLAIQAVDPTSVGAPIIGAAVPPEMQVLVERLNDLFRRVEDAMRREKTTIANIAHELRTPIAGLRTTLEFAQARPSDPGARQVQDRCLRMVLQMQGMVANLLTMARLEAGQDVLRREPVDVVPLVQDCWEPLEPQAEQRQLQLVWQLPDHAICATAREQLRPILMNLFDNAVSYTPLGGAVSIRCTAGEGGLELVVANDTDGTLTDTSRIFEPFWRGDHARSGGTHCGLGLALVQRMARCLGAEVAAQADGPAKRFEIRLRLPASPAALPAPEFSAA